MLYDNPQLVSTYLAAFQITGDPLYASEHLVGWHDVQRLLCSLRARITER